MNIYPLFSLPFLGYLLLFLLSSYFSFYLPGALVIQKKKLGLGLQIILSFCIGIALWGFQGYLLGFLHLRFLTYLYVVLIAILAYKKGLFSLTPFKEFLRFIGRNPLVVLLVLIGVLVQLSAVVGSGIMYMDGVRFFGVNRADGIMHVAFIQSIIHYFPPIEPGSYGHPITNYHYWSDLIIAELVRVWGLPITHTFFQYFPLLLSVLTAIGGYQLVRKLGFSQKAGIWTIFFLFFAGDATYVLILVSLQKLNFMTPALDNGASQFLNMPNAMAKVIFLGGIISLKIWLEERERIFWGIVTILLFASLVGIKIYYGIFVILGLGLVTLFILITSVVKQIREHGVITSVYRTVVREKYLIISGVVLCIISSLIYFPVNKNAGGLGWYPLEWPKIFLGKDVIDGEGWWLRMQVYQSAHNVLGVFVFDSIAILISLVCIHGTRLLGVLPRRDLYKKISWEMIVFFFPGIIIFHILGFFTLQTSGGLNVFNFFVVATVVLSLLSGMVLDRYSFSLKKPVITAFLIIVVFVTIPRVVFEVTANIKAALNPKNNSFLVSKDELDAFSFIRQNTPHDSIIQSHPENAQDYITPYVAFFSDRLSYLTGVNLQETHNQPLKERESKLKEVFSSKVPIDFFGQARAAGINLLYLRKVDEERLIFPIDNDLITKLYENDSVVVYKVDITR